MAGRQIVQLALRPNLVNMMESMLQGGIGVEEAVVGDGSPLVGRTLQQAGLLKPGSAHVLAVRRRDGQLHVNPDAELKLQASDMLIALGSDLQLQKLAAEVQ
jgi:Trk K+ transport system NAD-binding subunit